MGTVKMPSAPPGASQQTKSDLAPRTTGVIYKLPVVTGQLANQIGGEFGGRFVHNCGPHNIHTSRLYVDNPSRWWRNSRGRHTA